jgi:hypothetical protein
LDSPTFSLVRCSFINHLHVCRYCCTCITHTCPYCSILSSTEFDWVVAWSLLQGAVVRLSRQCLLCSLWNSHFILLFWPLFFTSILSCTLPRVTYFIILWFDLDLSVLIRCFHFILILKINFGIPSLFVPKTGMYYLFPV